MKQQWSFYTDVVLGYLLLAWVPKKGGYLKIYDFVCYIEISSVREKKFFCERQNTHCKRDRDNSSLRMHVVDVDCVKTQGYRNMKHSECL